MLGLSQNELIKALDIDLTQNRISEYEIGNGEPALPVLLKYARLAGVCMDVLVDDEQDLPAKLPSKPRHTHR
jgi:transcriptional regulator with XRE-family HTH domain